MRKNGLWIRMLRRLAVLAVVVLLLFTGEPDGVAVLSPAESAPMPEEVLSQRPVEQMQPQTLPDEPVGQEETAVEAGPVKMPEVPVKMPEEPVEDISFRRLPEGEPVEDSYFETAAFLGDSRTEGFMLYSGLDTGSYYYAVDATVESVFTKPVETADGEIPLLDAMAADEFERIYVMLGVNELGWKGTEIFGRQYGALIDRLRQDHPAAEIVLQTILPVGAKQEAKGSYVNNARITEYNGVIRRLAEEKNCWYRELGPAVSDEAGLLREDWSYDSVHLNRKGCRVWLEELRSHPVPQPAEQTENVQGGQ